MPDHQASALARPSFAVPVSLSPFFRFGQVSMFLTEGKKGGREGRKGKRTDWWKEGRTEKEGENPFSLILCKARALEDTPLAAVQIKSSVSIYGVESALRIVLGKKIHLNIC